MLVRAEPPWASNKPAIVFQKTAYVSDFRHFSEIRYERSRTYSLSFHSHETFLTKSFSKDNVYLFPVKTLDR